MDIFQAKRKGSHAFLQALNIGEAIDLDTRNRFKGRKQRMSKLKLVSMNSIHRLFEFQTPTLKSIQVGCIITTEFFSHPFKIFNCPKHTCNTLMILGARLKLAW